jgi:hypothetical protein
LILYELVARAPAFPKDLSQYAIAKLLIVEDNRSTIPHAEKKQQAINCHSPCGPHFGICCIHISDDCNINTRSQTVCFGIAFDSVSGGKESEFLTGAVDFAVQETEVFETEDETAFSANRENCVNGRLL